MIRICKAGLMLTLVLCMVVQTSFAASVVTLYGKTDSTEDITVLILKEGTDIDNIQNTDILYINQENVNDDGSFVLKLPFDPTEGYLVRSNKTFDVFAGERDKKIYVSEASGNDANTGESAESPLKTLDAAYGKLFMASEIVVMDDMALSLPVAKNEGFVLKGQNASVNLTLPAELSLSNDICIDNITLNGASTIYANGFKLKIGEGVTSADSSNSLTVYGGKKNAAFNGDTDIELLGGYYYRVYGGGNGGTVNGNTKVVFGGNANPVVTNQYNPANDIDCKIFGGGKEATVTGKTDITLDGNAVTTYVFGAGEGQNANVLETNVYIKGGKVMNVYGGTTGVSLVNCNTNITMTGGLAEAVFGGSERAALTGNTSIILKGGDVSRRVYSGCYNEFDLNASNVLSGGEWKSNYYVTGTTTLAIYPEVALNTKNQLQDEDKVNVGVFAGSRMKSQNDNEVNTIIYMNGCNSTHKGYIGEKSTKKYIITVELNNWLKSFEDYTVSATAGGTVYGTSTGGTVKIVPDTGYKGTVSGIDTEYLTEGLAALTSGSATVTFTRAVDYKINDLNATKGDSAVSGEADIIGSTVANEPKLVVVIYDDETGKMIACGAQSAETSGEKPFNLNCNLESGRRYIVKAMIWDSEIKPLTNCYTIEL